MRGGWAIQYSATYGYCVRLLFQIYSMSVSVFEARSAEEVHIPLVGYRCIACKLLRGGAGNQSVKRVNLDAKTFSPVDVIQHGVVSMVKANF